MTWFLRRKPTIRQLLATVITKLEKIMSGVDDLKAAIQANTDAVKAVGDSITGEITVVEQAIEKLKGGGLSDADAEALAQQLQGSVANLASAKTSLDDETTKLAGI